ncbi:MAG: PAS domain-containing protein, partial [Actinomycetota bacterium]
MTLPMPSKGWRLALIAACVIAPFVWSSWYLTSGIAEVRRADDVVQSAEAARAEINRLAALENAAGAGTTVFWSDVDEAVAGLRADNDVVIEMLPPADRADFDRTIDEYVTAVVETIREYLDGRIADGDVIDSERTEPLYSSLVDWIGLVRDDAVAASSDARRDADRGLQLGAIGVLASLSLFAFLIAGEHGRSRAKRAERSASARFRTLIEDSSDHIYVIDDDQKILFMSPAAQRAMGGEFTSASDLVAALGEEIQQVVFRLLKRPDGATEEILLHLDGRSEWYEVRVT